MTQRCILMAASLFGFLAVLLGSFGAHGLRNMVDEKALHTFEVGVRYQFYHTFALLYLSLAPILTHVHRLSAWAFIVGTVIFSGSLYALCLTGNRMLGAITPIGGVFFLAGWALLFYSTFR